MVKTKESQEIKVLKIVNRKREQKTFEIMQKGLESFITDASRYLRWLAEKKLVSSERVEGKNYKQWTITQKGKEYLVNYQKKK